jgi:hypothetical protein
MVCAGIFVAGSMTLEIGTKGDNEEGNYDFKELRNERRNDYDFMTYDGMNGIGDMVHSGVWCISVCRECSQ